MFSVQLLTEAMARTTSQQRVNVVLLSSFAGASLLLAWIGLYGVLSQFVTSRRREIGVRLALGARPAHILASISRQAAVVTVSGVAAGLCGALVLTRLMATLVFDISTRDPLTFAAGPLLLGVVAAAATLGPARRAVVTNPMVALREE